MESGPSARLHCKLTGNPINCIPSNKKASVPAIAVLARALVAALAVEIARVVVEEVRFGF